MAVMATIKVIVINTQYAYLAQSLKYILSLVPSMYT